MCNCFRVKRLLCYFEDKERLNMTVQLYYFPMSPPCRAVMLTAKAIGLEMDLIELNIMASEHMTSEYEQLNPQKTVPFLVDDDLKLSESRAIMAYLVDKYGENDELYPRDPESRALVDQRLYFDLCTLFASIFEYYMPVFRKMTNAYDRAQYEKIKDAFQILNVFLNKHDYVAGCNLTIADFALVASVTQAEAFGFDLVNYTNVCTWLERMQVSAPGYQEANGKPVEMFKHIVQESENKEKENIEEKEEKPEEE